MSTARYFAVDSIRADFVRWYDSVAVASIAYDFLGGAASDDPVPTELRRLRLIGVWRDSTTLHFANMLLGDDDPRMPLDATFDGFVAQFRRLSSFEPKPALTGVQECLFAAVTALFTDVVIHGSRERTAAFPVAYYMRSHEMYDSVAAARTAK